MKTVEYILSLAGQGETKEAALSKLFSQVQGEVRKSVKGAPIRVEPKDLKIVSADVTRYTERFLGILFPRARSRYSIQARVTVQVTVLDLDTIQFTEHKEQLSSFQHVLKLR